MNKEYFFVKKTEFGFFSNKPRFDNRCRIAMYLMAEAAFYDGENVVSRPKRKYLILCSKKRSIRRVLKRLVERKIIKIVSKNTFILIDWPHE
jgi:hypothetical protein